LENPTRQSKKLPEKKQSMALAYQTPC